MKVLHTWICFFFLSLQDEHTALTNAVTVYTGTEGGNVTVRCRTSWSDSLKIFCRQECKEKDILIGTTDVRAHRDKYSIEWKNKGDYWGEVFVTITQLNKSDSGWYRCGYYGSGYLYYEEIHIIVVDALLDGSSSEGKNISRQTGGEILVACSFSESSSWKSFCKEECEGQILAETTRYRVQRGRYSIEYIRGSSSGGIIYVSISQLTESDSGRYRCVQDRDSYQPAIVEFNIVVTDATTQSSDSEQQQDETTGTTATTQSSDSEQQQDETTGTTDAGWLYVGLALAVMTVLLSAAVFIYCRKRSVRHKETPVQTENSQTSRVYEDVREDRRRPPPPVEISSVYSNAKYTKPHGVETGDEYCDVTAAASQNPAEKDSSKLIYSELNFSQKAVGSSDGALRGHREDVVYSEPRALKSSHTSCSDSPVYSTVISRQQRADRK